jgi:thiol:disulfide interchange protein DsbD
MPFPPRFRPLACAVLALMPSLLMAAKTAAVDPAVLADARLQPTLNARVALIADHQSVQPGQRLTAGLRIVHDPGWHTYWILPGDSGLATRYTWQLPDGASAGEIRWPFPERLPFGPLTNFGYSGALLLPVALTVPAQARPGERFKASLRARWLICADTCIPDEATLTLDLPVAARAVASTDAAAFAESLSRVPVAVAAPKGHSWRDATHVATQIDGANDWVGDATRVEVFPLTPQIVASSPITASLGSDGALRFRHPASDAFDRMPERVEWVLGLHDRDGTLRVKHLTLPAEDARSPGRG